MGIMVQTEHFSSKWLLKEQLAFQSHDVFFGKCAVLTIIKLEKVKGKAETIPHLKLRTAEFESGWSMEKATARHLYKM